MTTLLREMEASAPSLLGRPSVRMVATISANDKSWGDCFLVEIDDRLLRVTRDRGQVFADVGFKGPPPKLWQLATLLRQAGPFHELPPDDVNGLGEKLQELWPWLRVELADAKSLSSKYGPPDAP